MRYERVASWHGSWGRGREMVKGFRSSAVCAERRSPRSYRRIRAAIAGADIVHVLGYRDPVGTMAASVAFRARVPYLLEPCGMMRPRVRSIAVKRAFDATIGRPVSTGRPGARDFRTWNVGSWSRMVSIPSDTNAPNGITLPSGEPGPRGGSVHVSASLGVRRWCSHSAASRGRRDCSI